MEVSACIPHLNLSGFKTPRFKIPAAYRRVGRAALPSWAEHWSVPMIGNTYRLSRPLPGIARESDGHHAAITIPAGSLVIVAPGPLNSYQLIEVLFQGDDPIVMSTQDIREHAERVDAVAKSPETGEMMTTFYLECETCLRLCREDILATVARQHASATDVEAINARIETAREAIRMHEADEHAKPVRTNAAA